MGVISLVSLAIIFVSYECHHVDHFDHAVSEMHVPAANSLFHLDQEQPTECEFEFCQDDLVLFKSSQSLNLEFLPIVDLQFPLNWNHQKRIDLYPPDNVGFNFLFIFRSIIAVIFLH